MTSGLEEGGSSGAFVAVGVDGSDAVAVGGAGGGGGVVEGWELERGEVESGAGCGGGFAVEVVAGEGGDEAGFVDGLPDEVDGEGGVGGGEGGDGEAGRGEGWVDLMEGNVGWRRARGRGRRVGR
jgi:hypothetical protein